MNQKQTKGSRPIRMTLETEAPLKVGQEFHILATAIATRGNQTLEGKVVQFFLNGTEIDNPAQTDQNGRAQYNVIGIPLDAKSITIEAQLIGQAARARKVVLLPAKEPKKKQPYDLEIITRGKDGKYFINITIVGEDGSGVKGIVRMITDEETRDFPTDEQGVTSLTLEVTERQKELEFIVLGSSRGNKKLRLSGKEKAKPKRPEPTQEELAGGFWKTLKIGRRKRKEAEK